MQNFKMTHKFLKVLSGSIDAPMTFQFFDDKKKDNTLAKWTHLKRSTATLKNMVVRQNKGAGVYVMVNRGDGKGRSAVNVVEVRALFVDLDGAPWQPAADMLKPHIRVESSSGRFHLYWLVSDCPLDQFKPIQQAIARKFDGDPQCVDLSRVLRLPGFLHQKYKPVLTELLDANDFPKYTTQEVIEGLQLDMAAAVAEPFARKIVVAAPAESDTPSTPRYEFTDSSSGEVFDLAIWARKNPDFDIIAAVDPRYRRGNPQDGKQHIICPFEEQHTDQTPDFGTFVANASPEHPTFTIHCCHAHCAGRDRLEYVQTMLVRGWFAVDRLQLAAPPPTAVIEIRRPLYVTYQTNEIMAAPEWSVLKGSERRVALDLMTKCWAEIDGMVADDDWAIARLLDMEEAEWMPYRKVFERTGWLIKFNGRLTNGIVKREFDNAQNAYMRSVVEGSRGGKIAANNRLIKLLSK